MRVRCITTDASAILENSLVAQYRRLFSGCCEPCVHLTPRKSYVVYALVETHYGTWMYVADDDYPSVWYPIAYPLDFFEIVDVRVSKLWKSGVSVPFAGGKGHLKSFEEWTNDPYFYERLVDKEKSETMIFNERKEFMDMEYPFPEEFRALTCFDTEWCQCPSCEHIWEDGVHRLGMKRCPACGEVLVDGLWTGE